MRENENLVGYARNVTLVPYRKEHVQTYHQWLQDPVLQEQTASEPLSLEEEYEMQRTWHTDSNKCTFILLHPSAIPLETDPQPAFKSLVFESETLRPVMIGDVNLFLSEEEVEEKNGVESSKTRRVGEIEIMVAENGVRGKGIGREAVLVMMRYAIETLRLSRIYAKISRKNEASLRLFRNRLGFRLCGTSEIFNEDTLCLDLEEEGKEEKREDGGVKRSSNVDWILKETEGTKWGLYEEEIN